MNHYNDLLALGINLKKSNGSVKTKCPKCSHTRKNKTDISDLF